MPRTLFTSGRMGPMSEHVNARWTRQRLQALNDGLTRIRVLHGSDLADMLGALLGDHARSCAAIDAAAELQTRVDWLEGVVEGQALTLKELMANPRLQPFEACCHLCGCALGHRSNCPEGIVAAALGSRLDRTA